MLDACHDGIAASLLRSTSRRGAIEGEFHDSDNQDRAGGVPACCDGFAQLRRTQLQVRAPSRGSVFALFDAGRAHDRVSQRLVGIELRVLHRRRLRAFSLLQLELTSRAIEPTSCGADPIISRNFSGNKSSENLLLKGEEGA